MNQIKKDIIDKMLKKNPKYRSFETEHFIYWILSESYSYDGYSVSREEFKYAKQYAVAHGTLPSMERDRSMLSKERLELFDKQAKEGYKNSSSPELYNGTHSYENILRYSKTYDSLELYYFRTQVRATFKNKSSRVIVQKKRSRIFSINNKGYVMVGGKRWLSLKNKEVLANHYPEIRGEVMKKLLESMIGKDWVNDVDESILISNKNSRRANSLLEAIELECGAPPAKFLYKFFKNDKNSLIKLYKLIEPNKISDIITFINNNKAIVTKIINETYDDKTNMLLFCFFLSKDNRCDKTILFDYFRMAFDSGVKINIKVSSYSTLKRNHDELNRKNLLKLSSKGQRLKVSKDFPNIKSIRGLDVEKIKTVERLNQESAELHHCVHSYKQQINIGDSAIYRLTFDSVPYTLQVRANKVKKNNEKLTFEEAIEGKFNEGEYIIELKLNQLKGRYNSNPPESIKPFLHTICVNNNIIPESVNNLSFKSEIKDKRKVIQIGSKILEKLNSIHGTVDVLYEGEPVENVVELQQVENFADFL